MSNNVNWTNDQKNAINSDGSALLVSAAAGSGKTAVLIERILRKLENTDIDRFIIVTFTEAAASQMKKGIADKIKERITDPETAPSLRDRLKKQLLLINDASISTMHSFCSKLIRSHFEKLEISADFSIMQPEERKLVFKEAYDEVTEELYDENNPDFLNLVSAYSKNIDDEAVFSMVETVYNASQNMPYPDKWFSSAVENFKKENMLESLWFREIISAITEKIQVELSSYKTLEGFLDENPQLELRDLFYDDLKKANRLLDILENGITDYASFQSDFKLGLSTFPSKYSKDANAQYFKSFRDDFRTGINDIIKEFLYCDEATLLKLLDVSLTQAETLIYLAKRISLVFDEKKADKNTLDYNDLEHLTIKLLTDENQNPSETAKEISLQYDEIIIDEYQDTNPVQEVIFSAISQNGKNLFMVGDMKQCIYKFRNAEPKLFTQKLDVFSENGNSSGKKVFLSQNFRSRKSVLDFTNLVFTQIMNRQSGEIDYDEKEMLYHGLPYPEKDPCNEILLLSNENAAEDELTGSEKEAYIIGAKIQKMIDEGFMVTDKKSGNLRRATYRDFAILLRTAKGVIDIFASTLAKMGIPVFVDDNTEYLLSSYEIKVLLAFLRIIDNPYDDVSAAAVLKSPMFGLSDKSLALASMEKGNNFCQKVLSCHFEDKHQAIIADNFAKKFKEYTSAKTYLNSFEMIKLILADSNFYEYAGAMSGGEQRQTNINYLLKCARDFEADSFKGIYAFIGYIDNYDDKIASMISPKKLPDNVNSVTVTTIHKSKGLEYPIVIIPKTGTKFNLSSKSKIETHNSFGFAFDCVSKERIKYKSPLKNAVVNVKKNEGISEEMRILYVALTRAKEKLIVVGSVSYDKLAKKLRAAAKCKDLILPSYISRQSDSLMEWLCMSLVRFDCFEELRNLLKINAHLLKTDCPVSVSMVDLEDFATYEDSTVIHEENEKIQADINEIDKNLSWRYNHTQNEVYTKYSVSSIKHKESNLSAVQRFSEKLRDINNETDFLTGSEKGTLIHLILEKSIKNKVSSENELYALISKLLEDGIITDREKNNIPTDRIMNFIYSDICKNAYNAKELYSEASFEIMQDSSIADSKTSGVDILVQGVIDLYFPSNDGYTVIDFKSDFVTQENVSEKAKEYEIQLKLYKEAVKKMHNTQNVKGFLYFLEINQFIEI